MNGRSGDGSANGSGTSGLPGKTGGCAGTSSSFTRDSPGVWRYRGLGAGTTELSSLPTGNGSPIRSDNSSVSMLIRRPSL